MADADANDDRLGEWEGEPAAAATAGGETVGAGDDSDGFGDADVVEEPVYAMLDDEDDEDHLPVPDCDAKGIHAVSETPDSGISLPVAAASSGEETDVAAVGAAPPPAGDLLALRAALAVARAQRQLEEMEFEYLHVSASGTTRSLAAGPVAEEPVSHPQRAEGDFDPFLEDEMLEARRKARQRRAGTAAYEAGAPLPSICPPKAARPAASLSSMRTIPRLDPTRRDRIKATMGKLALRPPGASQSLDRIVEAALQRGRTLLEQQAVFGVDAGAAGAATAGAGAAGAAGAGAAGPATAGAATAGAKTAGAKTAGAKDGSASVPSNGGDATECDAFEL